jgi:hypothetical protein
VDERKSEYSALADQAERLSKEAPTGGIAGSWRRIASGFRKLAELHEAARRHWKARGKERERRKEPLH